MHGSVGGVGGELGKIERIAGKKGFNKTISIYPLVINCLAFTAFFDQLGVL